MGAEKEEKKLLKQLQELKGDRQLKQQYRQLKQQQQKVSMQLASAECYGGNKKARLQKEQNLRKQLHELYQEEKELLKPLQLLQEQLNQLKDKQAHVKLVACAQQAKYKLRLPAQQLKAYLYQRQQQ